LQRRAAMLGATGPRPEAVQVPEAGGDLIPGVANQDLIREALASRGIRYRWGGVSRGGFDCSGFTRYLYERLRGIQLPHSASRQAHYGQKVARNDLQEGDLVFFHTYRRGISHVGIYIGGNRFVHAANTRRRVRVDTLTGYYLKRFVTARRLTRTGKRSSGGFGPPSAPTAEPPVEIPVDTTDQTPETPLDATPALDGGTAPGEQGEPSLPTRVEPDS
jgi:hypothetical protein